MNNQNEHLETLSEIRTLMERSSKFLSLSGISGISAGIIAIVGVVAASIYQGYSFFEKARVSKLLDPAGGLNTDFVLFLFDRCNLCNYSCFDCFSFLYNTEGEKKKTSGLGPFCEKIGLEFNDTSCYRRSILFDTRVLRGSISYRTLYVNILWIVIN